MANLDIVVPGQFTDLSQKPQLFALGELLRDLSESIESTISSITTITNTVDKRLQMAPITYPLL